MSRDLWTTFFADRADHTELQQLIMRHIPGATQPRRREIIYPGDGAGAYAVKLVFDKQDRLRALQGGALLTPTLEATIHDAISASLLTSTGRRVHRRVLFAHHKLAGSWRYKDRFQVLPIPVGAPQIDAVYGDHPFVLEVEVSASSDPGITHARAQRAFYEVELLLAGLVNSSIHPLTNRGFYGHWVQLPGTTTACAYRYGHYEPGVPLQDKDAFSPAEALAPILPPHELFGPMELGAGEPLSFPEGLTDVLNVYDELLHPQRDRFLRACHWVKLANELFLQSFSAAFMAIITAAETLFPAPQLPDCGSCGQPRYGLRQAFGTFLEDHVPLAYLTSSGFEDVPSFVARLKDLYDTRSAITHGGALRGWEAPTSGFTPQTNQDDSDLRTLVRIMPYALGAWLCQIPRGAPDD